VTLGTFLPTEVAREAATLVMIAAVGWLAGRSPTERLAWAAVVFGTWDITYYLGLWLVIGWPESLANTARSEATRSASEGTITRGSCSSS